MKKILVSFLSVAAAFAALTSCTKPDGEAALKSISLPASLNSSLSATVNGTIDEATKTVTFVIPAAAASSSFVPEFTLTRDDVLSVNGKEVTSGSTAVSLTTGTQIVVDDANSAMSVTYKVTVLGDDQSAALTSLIIKSADNAELISEDVVAEISEQMVVRVPSPAFRQELTLSLAATENDVIKVNNSAIEGGKALKVDTSFPVDIEVIDDVAGKTAKYVLKVGKILELKCDLIGSYTNDDLQDYVAIAVDEKADIPYLVVNENNTVEGVTTKNYATVLKYDGALSVVGNNKFSPSSATYCMIDVLDGKPYVAFVDAGAPTKSRVSCMAYDGNWSLVGEQGFGAKITGLSYYRISMILDPVSKYPIVALTTNEALNGQAKRDLSVSIFNGTEWDANKAVSGRTQTYCYNEKLARGTDKVALLAANQNDKTFSLYQYKDKSWSVLQSDLVIAGTSDICTYFADCEIAPDGTIWVAVGDNSSGSYLCQLYKYDGKELVKAANPLPGVTFNVSKCQWDLTFDAEGKPVVAVISADADSNLSAKLFTINPETKDWADPFDLPETPNASYMAAGRADNGNVYITYSTQNAGGKNIVNLYKYALEADILPE
ncbi:MAG: hypothetical protein MJZ09_01515 [Bacteroidales bacterium]|nr:hypothetical protein [Bacteroidales bacterium]